MKFLTKLGLPKTNLINFHNQESPIHFRHLFIKRPAPAYMQSSLQSNTDQPIMAKIEGEITRVQNTQPPIKNIPAKFRIHSCKMNKKKSYLKVEDDGPNESKGKFRISINDIFTADIDQFYFLIAKEAQRSFYILNGMKSHSATFSRLEKTQFNSLIFRRIIHFF